MGEFLIKVLRVANTLLAELGQASPRPLGLHTSLRRIHTRGENDHALHTTLKAI